MALVHEKKGDPMKRINASVFLLVLTISTLCHSAGLNKPMNASDRFEILVQECGDFKKVGWFVTIEKTESLATAFDIIAADRLAKIASLDTTTGPYNPVREIAFSYLNTNISLAETVLQLEALEGVTIICRRPNPGGFSYGN
jgi:hypothetical protein